MNLILTFIKRNFDGIHDVTVNINGKDYTYHLKYRQDVDLFNKYYNRGYKGKALNVLRKNNVKEADE